MQNPFAFPHINEAIPGFDPEVMTKRVTSGGMTLRDYFAAKALQGVIASMSEQSDEFDPEACSTWCYGVADAMLKAREA